ncbi:GvpL/GvpF family gas vesicle protein [Flexibacterium corallicola]|uniref:GvpL/GvpF family gas vesicle protein n=1 Tax=Flexibacterium corallicola TaxID=3037259 RepID=UPI00286F0BFA|nr:GvpL/GvpF family gas vesicle protein [Pseudovibrio sp. M1P-2-3]
MLVHVYAITDSYSAHTSKISGHEGCEITLLPQGGLWVAVSKASGEVLEASVERVWLHEQVLSQLLEHHAVLPMRFGMICEDTHLASFIGERTQVLNADLRRLNGAVEMALRVSLKNSPIVEELPRELAPPHISGRSYLLSRVKQREQRLAQAYPLSPLKAHLEACCRQSLWQEPSAEGEPYKVSCLIGRNEVSAFACAMKEMETPEVKISCTGPWAPYSFVSSMSALGVGT